MPYIASNILRASIQFQSTLLLYCFGHAGVPMIDQYLIFCSKCLDDNRALAEYNIHSGSTLSLIVRATGGVKHGESRTIKKHILVINTTMFSSTRTWRIQNNNITICWFLSNCQLIVFHFVCLYNIFTNFPILFSIYAVPCSGPGGTSMPSTSTDAIGAGKV